MIGRSPETVRRWRRLGYMSPTATDSLTEEALWSPDDVRRMRLYVIASRSDRIARLKKFWRRSPAA